jgi:hypothetical protein
MKENTMSEFFSECLWRWYYFLCFGPQIGNSSVYRIQQTRCFPFLPEDEGRSIILNVVSFKTWKKKRRWKKSKTNKVVKYLNVSRSLQIFFLQFDVLT